MKKIISILVVVVLLAGCSSGVSQAEYDTVIKERDELKASITEYLPSDSLVKSTEVLTSIFPNSNVSETKIGKTHILQLTSVLSMENVSDDVATKGSELSSKILSLCAEPWFDYDYVWVDIMVVGVGKIASFSVSCSNLSSQSTTWE